MFTRRDCKAFFGLIIILYAITPLKSFAGAWVQKPTDLLYVTTQSGYFSHAFFDSNGRSVNQPAFLKAESNHYIEYGIDDSLTGGANLFVQHLQQETITTTTASSGASHTQRGSATNTGLADSELFLKQRLLDESGYTLSFQPLIKLPSLYVRDQLPKAGSDGYDAELSLLGGYGFDYDDAHHFIDMRLGYRHRFNPQLNDQWKLDAKLGYSISPQWQIIPAAYLTLAQSIPKQSVFTESGQNDYDLLKLECALLYNLSEKTYIQLGAFDHVAGYNAGEGYGFMFSTGIHY